MPTYSAPLAEDSNGVTRPHREGDLPRGATYAYGPNRVEVTTEEPVEAYENDDEVGVLEPAEPDDETDEDGGDVKEPADDGESDDEPVEPAVAVPETDEPETDEHECEECGDTFDSVQALSGHKSSHSR
jgi:hypothetical protein